MINISRLIKGRAIMITMFLANVIGWYLVIFSIMLIFRQEQFKLALADIMSKPGLFLIFALFSLVLGLIMVISHNIWIIKWPLVITLFSWMVLISSLVRLFFPHKAQLLGKSFIANPQRITVVGIIALIIGLFLLINVAIISSVTMAG